MIQRRIQLVAALAVFSFMAVALHALERPVLDVSGLGASSRALAVADGGIDLHAHLFMKPGMALLFQGDFFAPLSARSWRSRFASQANPVSVEASGASVFVVALYANPLFTWSPRDAIREEIRQAERFVAESAGQWVIARSPDEASRALGLGARVIILSLERASGILETEADLREFIDRDGVRIVTPLHLMDDRFGGVAFLHGYHMLGTPWAWLGSLAHPVFDDTGVRVNVHGLSPAGRALARTLAARGVWLDLSHASDASQVELAAIAEAAGQPLLYTHTGLRRFMRTERGISDAQLEAVKRTAGIVGICPSEDSLNPTPVRPEFCGTCPQNCDWGVPAFAEHYAQVAAVLGSERTMVGTDFNGAVPHLHPSCGTGTPIDREGFWNVGQLGDFWKAARILGAPVPERLGVHVEAFLKTWAMVKAKETHAPR